MADRKPDSTIKTAPEAGRTRIIARGEMDLASVVALNRAMSEASSRDVPVDLDLSAVTFLDSRFTAAIRGWERQLGQAGVTLAPPDDDRLRRLLALRSQARDRIGFPAEEVEDEP